MKTLKIVLITFVATAALTIALSASNAFMVITTPLEKDPGFDAAVKSLAREQDLIKKGYSYDPETGKKLNITPTELRFRAIEARLSALEKKK